MTTQETGDLGAVASVIAPGVERLMALVDGDCLPDSQSGQTYLGLELAPSVQLVTGTPAEGRKLIGYSAVIGQGDQMVTVSHAGEHTAGSSKEIVDRWLGSTSVACFPDSRDYPTSLLPDISDKAQRMGYSTLAIVFIEVNPTNGNRHVTLAIPEQLGRISIAVRQAFASTWPIRTAHSPRTGAERKLQGIRTRVPADVSEGILAGDVIAHAANTGKRRGVK